MKLKRLFSLWIAVCILATCLPTTVSAAKPVKKDDLHLTIDEQLRTFAQSIYYSGSDEAAAWALATHGVTNRSTMKVGKNHALTATLYNSNLMQYCLTGSLVAMIRHATLLDIDTFYGGGGVTYTPEQRGGSTKIYYTPDHSDTGKYIFSISEEDTIPRNSYDSSLEWLVGHVSAQFTIKRIAINRDTIAYSVKITIQDRFDFRGDNGSVSKDLASVLGSALFREFDWESTVSLNITVPNICEHRPNRYHFVYDAEAERFSADTSDGYSTNGTEAIAVDKKGETMYYHQLDTPICLMHNQPWVMEYDVKNPAHHNMIDQTYGGGPVPIFVFNSRNNFLVYVKVFDEEGNIVDWLYYGLKLNGTFQFNTTDVYTFCIENVLFPDGSNMLYMTVYNKTADRIEMDFVPIDDRRTSSGTLLDAEDNGLNGYDYIINYISNPISPFRADYYDLRIWERGKDATQDAFLSHSVVEPTCDTQGYTAHLCPQCGYEARDTYTAAIGHDYGAWYGVKAPSCSAEGEERRDCRRCKGLESRPIAKTEHNLVSYDGQSPTCTEAGWTEYEACADCDYTTYAALPTLPHSYESVVTPPTCDKQGYTTYTCADCGDTYVSDHLAAAGHKYESVTTPPTCTTGGYTTHTCTLCGYRYEEFYSSANPHQYQCTVTPPTCGDTGYLVYTCACGDQFATAFGTATGRHVYDGDRDPDCNTCGAVREVAAIPLGDVTGDGKVNNRDLGLLQQYINGWGTAIDAAAADVTADGKVNNRDLGLLQQYINGWGVELG